MPTGRRIRTCEFVLDARPTQDPAAVAALYERAFDLAHAWVQNIKANPGKSVAANRPAKAVDACWTTDGSLIAGGDDVWAGVLDDRSAGPCAEAFPLFSTSRIVAGASIAGDVYKCQTMPVRTAVQRGVYGDGQLSEEQVRRLEQIFPEGVCDYGLPGVAQPPVNKDQCRNGGWRDFIAPEFRNPGQCIAKVASGGIAGGPAR